MDVKENCGTDSQRLARSFTHRELDGIQDHNGCVRRSFEQSKERNGRGKTHRKREIIRGKVFYTAAGRLMLIVKSRLQFTGHLQNN